MHVPIARDLRDHRGGCDRGAAGIAVDDRPVLELAAGKGEAVNQAHRAGHGDTLEAPPERGEVGDV
jgi:hypothetical protein